MKLLIEMPTIEFCGATACAYNVDQRCHARAITIGDSSHPACDTYLPAFDHVAGPPTPAGVGACKISECRHNHELECQAKAIAVAPHARHADCVTFDRRERPSGQPDAPHDPA